MTLTIWLIVLYLCIGIWFARRFGGIFWDSMWLLRVLDVVLWGPLFVIGVLLILAGSREGLDDDDDQHTDLRKHNGY